MIREYMQKAMDSARYEVLSDDGSYYGEIPLCPGVISNAGSLEGCRRELESVLEEWLLLRIHRNLEVPEVEGLTIVVSKANVA